MAEREDRGKGKKEEGREFRSHAFAGTYSEVRDAMGWQEWINGVLGVWLVVIPFIGLGYSTTTLVITGILVALLGFWGAAMKTSQWQQWVNGVLGLWVIVIPFLALTGSVLVWTLVVTGIVIAVLGFWAAMRKM